MRSSARASRSPFATATATSRSARSCRLTGRMSSFKSGYDASPAAQSPESADHTNGIAPPPRLNRNRFASNATTTIVETMAAVKSTARLKSELPLFMR